jgi:hypothetical protein
VQKAKGAPLRLAFTAGAYEAIVRDTANVAAGRALRCKLALTDDRVTALDLGACESVRLTSSGVKGDDEPDEPEPEARDAPPATRAAATGRAIEPWAVEGGFGFMGRVEDDFTRRLQTFGYVPDRGLLELPHARMSLAVSKGFLPHLAVGLQLSTLSGDSYSRNLGDSADSYSFNAYGANLFVRLATSLAGEARPGALHLDLYGQVGLGMSLGRSTLTTGSTKNGASETSSETDYGYVVGGAAGLALVTRGALVVYAQGAYDHAPTFKNLVGEVHDSGGPSGQLGLRFQLGQ